MAFDDPSSVKYKTQWIKDNGYAGGMIWSMDLDDFRGWTHVSLAMTHERVYARAHEYTRAHTHNLPNSGYCGQGRFPILAAINTGLFGTPEQPPELVIPKTVPCNPGKVSGRWSTRVISTLQSSLKCSRDVKGRIYRISGDGGSDRLSAFPSM